MRARSAWAATITAGLVAGGLAASPVLASASARAPAGPVLPARVYAPYFEAYLSGSLASVASSRASVRDARVRAGGGQDGFGRVHADLERRRRTSRSARAATGWGSSICGRATETRSCRSAGSAPITAEPRSPTPATACRRSRPPTSSLSRTYHLRRLDMDIEANSVNNSAGIDRRTTRDRHARSVGQEAGNTAVDPVHPGRRAERLRPAHAEHPSERGQEPHRTSTRST